MGIAIKPGHKNRLHAYLGIKPGAPIPLNKLMQAKTSPALSVKKMVNFALNARKWGK
jgi:hypothetical protein